ncbi:alpha/beta fold hydrolase [Tomitella gaofuii]|uniref:alpha/beta fold hydrolase n=1 Tax=Tomitella gaofuii TaxID=2760083 RepID=UPI0015F9011E|nr:alpha/beta hydrolase [Tomitella gaofuii]
MPVTYDAPIAVLLPGTGSDDDFASRALAPAATALGAGRIIAVTPRPALIDGYHRALDEAARAAGDGGRILIGGVSIGAMAAVQWALRSPGRVAGIIGAMPSWCGRPDGNVGAASAAITAQRVAADGVEPTIAQMRATSPRWLGDELARSWRALGADLAGAMRAASAYVAPTPAQIAGLDAPLGVVGVIDDPLHPVEVARAWARAAHRSAVSTITLDELGADPSVLSTAGAEALRRAAHTR